MIEEQCISSGGVYVNDVCYLNDWENLNNLYSKHTIKNTYEKKSSDDSYLFFFIFLLVFIIIFFLIILLIKKNKK